MVAYPKNRSEITLAKECVDIGWDAFIDCWEFKSVKIPDSVKNIGYWAFCWCQYMETVEFPKSFSGDARLGAYAFDQCKNLKKIVFRGDAPKAGVRRTGSRQNFLWGAPNDVVIEVNKGSKGWNGSGSTDLPELWPLDGNPKRPIRYIE